MVKFLLAHLVYKALYCEHLETNLHCDSKKFPPLNSLKLCRILTDFNFFHRWKAYEICYKSVFKTGTFLRHSVSVYEAGLGRLLLKCFVTLKQNVTSHDTNEIDLIHSLITYLLHQVVK